MNNNNIVKQNTELLEKIGITNKTHIKVLSKYHELKILRVIVFIFSFFNIMTTTNGYIAASAIVYLLFEIFLFRYDINLRNMYRIRRNKSKLEVLS